MKKILLAGLFGWLGLALHPPRGGRRGGVRRLFERPTDPGLQPPRGRSRGVRARAVLPGHGGGSALPFLRLSRHRGVSAREPGGARGCRFYGRRAGLFRRLGAQSGLHPSGDVPLRGLRRLPAAAPVRRGARALRIPHLPQPQHGGERAQNKDVPERRDRDFRPT